MIEEEDEQATVKPVNEARLESHQKWTKNKYSIEKNGSGRFSGNMASICGTLTYAEIVNNMRDDAEEDKLTKKRIHLKSPPKEMNLNF